MKNIKFIYSKIILLSGLLFFAATSCEREISDEVEFATNSKTGGVFIDSPIGLGSDFYFPFEGSKATAWTVDDNESYESQSSMRFDVPNADDPDGNFAGAIFRVDGAGRNLTEFDALTFWAKASQGVSIGQMGFGTDFGENKYQVTRSNISLSTNWVKYTIPIPDASKLIEERGMFWYSAGTQATGGFGYTFWIDELKFEKLGTIGQPKPSILNGEDMVAPTFVGGTVAITDFTQTFNLGSGLNQTNAVTASYFDFHSSNPAVATVDFKKVDDEIQAVVLTHSKGTAVLTASVNGVLAAGSLKVEVARSFDFAPTPPERNTDNVISIFSDAYTNVPVSLISDFGEFQNSTLNAFKAGEDNILNYNDVNFFGIEFNGDIPTINASDMTLLHMDVFVIDALQPGAALTIQLRNIGPNNIIETNIFTGGPSGDDTQIQTSPTLSAGQWISVDFNITGLTDRSALGQIVFVSDNTAGPKSFYVDNIYFYKNE
ncbi:glycosyl hydrolase family 16 [Thalassobellus suaedae]|uniref:Glycosyl hydrolase family 16 n=1 Tax=Thalassobellus suaedae TaxID=3074124 RepID=A0ABY9Y869_9FLAO|nr:glycosyl hydrolase family 16 [Flavobacteriaceae bacterium HL-DH10]